MLAGDRTALIDAGIGQARIREIDSRSRIDALVISHSHPDHILAWHVPADRQLLLPEQTPESVSDLRLLGHRFVEGRQDAFDRYLAAFDRRRELVFDLCRKPADLEAMVRHSPFYRNRMYDATLQRIFETRMVRKNLEVLIAQGVVVKKQGRFGRA